MKYVFGRKIWEAIWPEIFEEHINPNIGLQSIVLYMILMSLLVYLNCKNISKTEL